MMIVLNLKISFSLNKVGNIIKDNKVFTGHIVA